MFGLIVPQNCKLIVIILAMMFMGLASCSQQETDKEIKADIATKAKTDVDFAGVSYTVDKGDVSLTGKCPTVKSKDQVEQTIKSINIVKGIIDQIQIAPVVLDDDFALKQSTDSVLATYPMVKAEVAQQVVVLTGRTQKQNLGKLMAAITKLHPTKIDNQLAVQ